LAMTSSFRYAPAPFYPEIPQQPPTIDWPTFTLPHWPGFTPPLTDPFVTAGKPNGTGLGLTLARRIAEEHGGSVFLEESIQESTVFTLSLTKRRLL